MATSPTNKARIRKEIPLFCNLAEKSQLKWHYTQARPFHGFGVPADRLHVNDCSGYVSLVFNWAMHKTGIYIADPLGEHYNGYGYTGTLIDWLSKNGKEVSGQKYLVGDVAINGHSKWDTDHTFICKQAGTATSSRWSSNGNENAPNEVTLNYHPVPLAGVFRHPVLL